MAIKFSVEVRNALVGQIESAIGASPRLIFFTGTIPANTTVAAPIGGGTVIATMVLPADWLSSPPVSGSVSLSGSWTTTAVASGSISYYRIYDANGIDTGICHEQGSVTATGGGGDITLDSINAATGQTITMITKTYTAAGA